MAGSSAFDLHGRLRASVRGIAGDLLAAHRGVDLDGDPDRARAILGDDVWALVRADRPAPTDRHAPGIRPDELERVVVALEAV